MVMNSKVYEQPILWLSALHEGLEPYHMLLDTKGDHTDFEINKAMLVETKPPRYTLYYN